MFGAGRSDLPLDDMPGAALRRREAAGEARQGGVRYAALWDVEPARADGAFGLEV